MTSTPIEPSVVAHPPAEAQPEARARPSLRAVAAAVFGPRPVESAVWGLASGLVFGLPLVLPYFLVHVAATNLISLALGNETNFWDADVALIAVISAVLAVIALAGIAVLTALVARLRRASAATVLLVTSFASLVPYGVFYYALLIA